MVEIKLNLKQNALFTIFHALQHLAATESWKYEQGEDGWEFDDDDHIWSKKSSKHITFFIDDHFQHPPNYYDYKFVIQHFVQALEVLLLARLREYNKDAIFKDKSKEMTINFYQGIDRLSYFESSLFNPDQLRFIKYSKELRNKLEHYEINFSKKEFMSIARQLFYIISYLCYRFWSLNISEYYSYDPVRDEEYDIISAIESLNYNTDEKIVSADKLIQEWLIKNPDDKLMSSICCNMNSYSISEKICVICNQDIWGDIEMMLKKAENDK